jgi:hypothetical protein
MKVGITSKNSTAAFGFVNVRSRGNRREYVS